jgi:hypothetical protein
VKADHGGTAEWQRVLERALTLDAMNVTMLRGIHGKSIAALPADQQRVLLWLLHSPSNARAPEWLEYTTRHGLPSWSPK